MRHMLGWVYLSIVIGIVAFFVWKAEQVKRLRRERDERDEMARNFQGRR